MHFVAVKSCLALLRCVDFGQWGSKAPSCILWKAYGDYYQHALTKIFTRHHSHSSCVDQDHLFASWQLQNKAIYLSSKDSEESEKDQSSMQRGTWSPSLPDEWCIHHSTFHLVHGIRSLTSLTRLILHQKKKSHFLFPIICSGRPDLASSKKFRLVIGLGSHIKWNTSLWLCAS